MEVPHTNFTEVTGVVLVEVGTVVVLTTGHTTTTGVLTVLANATVTGGNMTAAIIKIIMSVFIDTRNGFHIDLILFPVSFTAERVTLSG